jgi:hypothetical protein
MGVDFYRYRKLSYEKQLLIASWFKKAWDSKDCNGSQCYSPFISAWIAFNSWAACITEEDTDRAMIQVLEDNQDLINYFQSLLNGDFHKEVKIFYKKLPIVKLQKIRQLQRALQVLEQHSSNQILEGADEKLAEAKREICKWKIDISDSIFLRRPVDEIIRVQIKKIKEDPNLHLDTNFAEALFAPKCWIEHRGNFETIEENWTNTIQSIYRVRCNLFHGDKSPVLQPDQQIVSSTFRVMLHVFYRIFSKYEVINSEDFESMDTRNPLIQASEQVSISLLENGDFLF